jgi:hypothetical protein
MSTTNNSVPGMVYPTQKGMVGSNPADSARLAAVNKSQSQAQANALMAGGKMRKRRHQGGAVVVPQYQMLYDPQGGNGTNPNNQIQGNAQTSTQMAANSVYDQQATQAGGSKRRKGGNPNWLWGCMSGGKKKTRKSNRKHSKRTRKHRRSHKHRRN